MIIFFFQCFFILGEALTDEQVEELFADCMDPEDDEGMIPYSRKYYDLSRMFICSVIHNLCNLNENWLMF